MIKDNVDWKILKLLQQDARLSNTEIGRRVGLTSPAIAERIKRLEDVGVITAYNTKLNYALTGYQFKAIITLKVFTGRLQPFLKTIASYKEVINCYRITGAENIIMEVLLTDQNHLERFIDKVIQYGETKTHIVLSNVIEDNPISNF
jgi:Lrp/AsnC family leucine-responsive transcriptional regulator